MLVVERDGVRYYLTYFSTLDCGYVSEENLTQDPSAVIAEKVVYVRTPQNLRPEKDSYMLGSLVEQGTGPVYAGSLGELRLGVGEADEWRPFCSPA